MKQWRLSHRILALALAPVWIITILLTGTVAAVGTTQIDGALKERGALIARHLSSACEYGAFSGNREVLQALTQATLKEEDAQGVVVTDALNNVLVSSGKLDHIESNFAQSALKGNVIHGAHSSLIFATPIYQGTPATDNFDLIDHGQNVSASKPKLLGFAYLELSTVSSQHAKTLFVFICFLIGVAGTAVASFFAFRMSRDLTRPLSRLIEGVHNMAKGDFDTRIKANSGGELQDLEEEHMRSKRYGSQFSIALIDVDKFKSINDTFGHSAGDQVLVSIGIILQENIRSSDAVGRWGGEEFLVIFRETSAEDALVISEKLRESIAVHEFHLVGHRTASFGVTHYRHPDSILEIMIRADNALYEAKNKGRNCVEFQDH